MGAIISGCLIVLSVGMGFKFGLVPLEERRTQHKAERIWNAANVGKPLPCGVLWADSSRYPEHQRELIVLDETASDWLGAHVGVCMNTLGDPNTFKRQLQQMQQQAHVPSKEKS